MTDVFRILSIAADIVSLLSLALSATALTIVYKKIIRVENSSKNAGQSAFGVNNEQKIDIR